MGVREYGAGLRLSPYSRADGATLTDAPDADPPRDGRINRRSFTDEEKLAIVMETKQTASAWRRCAAAMTS